MVVSLHHLPSRVQCLNALNSVTAELTERAPAKEYTGPKHTQECLGVIHRIPSSIGGLGCPQLAPRKYPYSYSPSISPGTEACDRRGAVQDCLPLRVLFVVYNHWWWQRVCLLTLNWISDHGIQPDHIEDWVDTIIIFYPADQLIYYISGYTMTNTIYGKWALVS